MVTAFSSHARIWVESSTNYFQLACLFVCLCVCVCGCVCVGVCVCVCVRGWGLGSGYKCSIYDFFFIQIVGGKLDVLLNVDMRMCCACVR